LISSSASHEWDTAYIPVSVATLIPEKLVGVSLFLYDESDEKMHLYCGPNIPLGETALSKLIARGHSRLYLLADEHSTYQQYLRENLNSVLDDKSVSVQKRFSTLNEVVRDILAVSFKNGKLDESVETCQLLAGKTVEFILQHTGMESELFGVLHHDYHTFTHSANVSYFCAMLAGRLGITDQQELQEIASGALLHDIGKLDIPEQILCKPDRLDEAEFEIIRRHPRTGFTKLCHRNDLSHGQLMMVYQHHERLDGKGYPVGILADEIHPWAKICSVADVFEALTSNRPYRKGMTVKKAFQLMDRDCETAFDRKILECWKMTIQQ